jgi:long-subunit acyl-CoA synthetase (AMP-forming)
VNCDDLLAFGLDDLGAIDDDGYLYVRGRRKNLLITSLGRNVSPEWVERELLARNPIAQAVVNGEGRPYLSALLWPTRAETTTAELAAAVEAANAALHAIAALATTDAALAARLVAFRARQTEAARAMTLPQG